MSGVDDKDRAILLILRSRGRITLTELGRQVNLSPASVKNRLEKLERLGAIKGYSTVVDPAFLDEFIQAIFEVRLSVDDRSVDGILKRIATLDNVCAVYRRTGQNQIMIKAHFNDTAGVKEFAGLLKRKYFGKNLERVEVTIILDAFKDNWVKLW